MDERSQMERCSDALDCFLPVQQTPSPGCQCGIRRAGGLCCAPGWSREPSSTEEDGATAPLPCTAWTQWGSDLGSLLEVLAGDDAGVGQFVGQTQSSSCLQKLVSRAGGQPGRAHALRTTSAGKSINTLDRFQDAHAHFGWCPCFHGQRENGKAGVGCPLRLWRVKSRAKLPRFPRQSEKGCNCLWKTSASCCVSSLRDRAERRAVRSSRELFFLWQKKDEAAPSDSCRARGRLWECGGL